MFDACPKRVLGPTDVGVGDTVYVFGTAIVMVLDVFVLDSAARVFVCTMSIMLSVASVRQSSDVRTCVTPFVKRRYINGSSRFKT